MSNVRDHLYENRENFIIIGLTGALGSGCTTTSNILGSDSLNVPTTYIKNEETQKYIDPEFSLEYRRSLIVEKFYNNTERKWGKFFQIRISDILFLLVMYEFFKGKKDNLTLEEIDEVIKNSPTTKTCKKEKNIDFQSFFKNGENIIEDFQKIRVLANNLFEEYINKYEEKKCQEPKEGVKEEEIDDRLNLIKEFLAQYVEKNSFFTSFFQIIGKNIRQEGKIEDKKPLELKNFDKDSIYIIPEIVRRIIRLITIYKKRNYSYFVIDALRNPYEIEYFRNRYFSFYLLSILAEESNRDIRLSKIYNADSIKKIKKEEKADKVVSDQNIQFCIGKGDIFIDNNKDEVDKEYLTYQLMKYIALIRNPGLFTPTNDERNMQVALTAKLNSGCISRQVGAAVIGEDGYVRGFGWNEVPENHIPCVYRTPNALKAKLKIFSEYERSKEYREGVTTYITEPLLQDAPFCFKDIQQKIEGDEKIEDIKKNISQYIKEHKKQDAALANTIAPFIDSELSKIKFKNPTRERALHAEENAFLQIAKSGGQSVRNGTLYTTASPCALCAKKAMQLKIKRIVYIDPYPDISNDQILKSGRQEEWPILDFFKGAIGTAYFRLYSHLIGIKDEQEITKK